MMKRGKGLWRRRLVDVGGIVGVVLGGCGEGKKIVDHQRHLPSFDRFSTSLFNRTDNTVDFYKLRTKSKRQVGAHVLICARKHGKRNPLAIMHTHTHVCAHKAPS